MDTSSPGPLLALTLVATVVAAMVSALATRVQLLPDVIDLSLIPTGAGLGSLSLTTYGVLRRYDHDRVARNALLGTLIGGLSTAAGVTLLVIANALT